MDFINALENFHLLRPYWLLALLPLAALVWGYSRAESHSRNWASVVDERLLPHLLGKITERVKSIPVKRLFFFGSLIIIALSGPVFEKRPQPVFKTQSALVIILDLSLSMDATDIKPSRLKRAHFKINDILKQRNEGQTALITYAAEAFVVSPLTDDAETIISQIPALETDIMPTQGSRLDIALSKARELFINAGHTKGHIFVISDSINDPALNTIKALKNSNIKTSVLALGTPQGAPIAAKGGGFVKDNQGSIVVPKLDTARMKKAARFGGGQYSLISADDSDINRLLSSIKMNKNSAEPEQADVDSNKFLTDTWHEEGPWLLLIVIPFAAYLFRKGLVFVFILYLIPLPKPAQAFEWAELWNNKDQLGETALQQGEPETAANLFNNPEWKAAAQYKAKKYQQAAETLSKIDTADANYNRGNALAKAGQLEQAISAFERTLQLQPDHEDAKYNLALLEQEKQDAEKKQPDNDQQQDNQQGGEDSSEESTGDKDSQSQNNQSSKNQSQKNQQQNNQQQSQQQDQGQSDKQSGDEQQSQTEQARQSDQDKAEENNDKNQASQEQESDSQTDKAEQALQQQLSESDASPDLDQQQTQQWLKKIPDNPGGLLRRKFKYQYGRGKQQTEQEQW